LAQRLCLAVAGLGGAMAVAAAASGAHGLDGQAASWIEKGSRFQLIHACALLALARAPLAGLWPRLAALLFLAGMVLFSGSLYAMALSAWKPVFLVPLGGGAYLCGWLALAAAALRQK
jgi:uncharacterized membrane protein YgdD (TMEM256/DUF423 family)